jgi:hypothetical protein
MQLNVHQRLVLMNILPPQSGSLTSLRIIRKFREELSFDEAEHVQLQFANAGEKAWDGTVVPDGQISWAPIPILKDVEIGPVARRAITAAINRLSEMAERGQGPGLEEAMLAFLEQFLEPESGTPATDPPKAQGL